MLLVLAIRRMGYNKCLTSRLLKKKKTYKISLSSLIDIKYWDGDAVQCSQVSVHFFSGPEESESGVSGAAF